MEGSSKLFDLEIVTPRQVVYTGKAAAVTCPGVQGSFQVLHNHAPFLSALEVGHIVVEDESGRKTYYAIGGGVSQIFHNAMKVLADTAELAAEIDVTRAEAAKSRAELRLRERGEGTDVARAQAALLRAINRLKVSQLV